MIVKCGEGSMTEKPLVKMKEIAPHVGLYERAARRLLIKAKVPLLEIYRPIIAVYPDVLRKYIERYNKGY